MKDEKQKLITEYENIKKQSEKTYLSKFHSLKKEHKLLVDGLTKDFWNIKILATNDYEKIRTSAKKKFEDFSKEEMKNYHINHELYLKNKTSETLKTLQTSAKLISPVARKYRSIAENALKKHDETCKVEEQSYEKKCKEILRTHNANCNDALETHNIICSTALKECTDKCDMIDKEEKKTEEEKKS